MDVRSRRTESKMGRREETRILFSIDDIPNLFSTHNLTAMNTVPSGLNLLVSRSTRHNLALVWGTLGFYRPYGLAIYIQKGESAEVKRGTMIRREEQRCCQMALQA